LDNSFGQYDDYHRYLLISLAEQLKLPFIQISNEVELCSNGYNFDFSKVQTISDNALSLLEAYSLSLRLASRLEYELVTESVSISSILYEALIELKSIAKLYDVQLELDINGKHGPVAVHRQGLQAAFVGLASSLIEALPAQANKKNPVLYLASHRSRYGLVAGIYSSFPDLNNRVLNRGRSLQAYSRQPLMNLSQSSASGIFIADSILKALKLNLHASRHNNLSGFGVILRPSHQLSFV